LLIGYANFCSSVQDHIQKESKDLNKKKLWSIWRRTAPEGRSAPEVIVLLKWWRHQKQVHQKQVHQKLYITRSSSS